jgi:uncharacterized phiE125 gp8 family phage protein
MIIFAPKDPAATEKFEFDFTARLGSDTIEGDATLVPDGVTIDSDQVDDGKVDMVLSGGTAGTVATVECTIVSSGGETLYQLAVVPIGGEAIDLATAKAAQRIEDDSEDALLSGFLRAAVGMVERRTGKNLTQKVVTQEVNGFAAGHRGQAGCGRYPYYGGEAIPLFKGPVSEVLGVVYDDGDGVEQDLASFRLVEGANARLLPAFNERWPATAFGPGTVRVTYVAGYDPTELPPELVQAAILLFGHYNANREAVVAGAGSAAAIELPLGVEALIAPYRAPGIA